MGIIDKPWGKEELLTRQDKYMVKRLHMKAGHRCSLQYHRHKVETIIVVSGILLVTRNHIENITLNPGDHLTILALQKHRMTGITDVVYLEASTSQLNDVVRIEDDYDRQ